MSDLLCEVCNKTDWPDGPWKAEPDYVAWESHGHRCVAIRNGELGNLCGYVEVKEGHPWFGLRYDVIDAEVHGGLTFDSGCGRDPKPGDTWWVGFDCAHAFDSFPRYARHGGFYRNIEFVRAETNRLAEQAARVAIIKDALARLDAVRKEMP